MDELRFCTKALHNQYKDYFDQWIMQSYSSLLRLNQVWIKWRDDLIMKNLSNEVSVSSTSVSQWALSSCCWPDIESNKAQGQGPASRKPPYCSPRHSNWRQRTEWGPGWMKERTNLSLKRKETLMLIRGEVYGTYDTLEWGWFWF